MKKADRAVPDGPRRHGDTENFPLKPSVTPCLRGLSQRDVKAFEMVKTIGLALPGVEATTKYDGSPVLKLGGCFMAGLATHRSAEPDTLVVRVGLDDRELFLEDAPETYYLTDYYRAYPTSWCVCRAWIETP